MVFDHSTADGFSVSCHALMVQHFARTWFRAASSALRLVARHFAPKLLEIGVRTVLLGFGVHFPSALYSAWRYDLVIISA